MNVVLSLSTFGMKKRIKKPRNYFAVSAHFRRSGPMKDKRSKLLDSQIEDEIQEMLRDNEVKVVVDIEAMLSGSRPDLFKFLEE